MSITAVRFGHLSVSRLVLGGNPFSGFSHQTPEKNRQMVRYYTTARIKETLREAEALGIKTFIGRADRHITRVLSEYWDEGNTIQWFAQTCPEYGALSQAVARAIGGGAQGCYLHGGQMDFLLAQNRTEEIPGAVAQIREAGLVAGIAGHNPLVFEWAEENLDVDFYMCAYYSPSRRDKHAEHVPGTLEQFAPEDREAMVRIIRQLSKPVIHYKVLAAGRHDPAEALSFVARHLRPQDAVCVGVYTEDHPRMLAEDLRLLEKGLQEWNRQ